MSAMDPTVRSTEEQEPKPPRPMPAVRSTAGMILTWHGSPIMSLYGSCCGGMTAAAFGAGSLGNTPYLKVQKDTLNGSQACRASPHFDWACAFDAGALASALNTDSRTSPGSHLRDVRVIRYDSSGRAEYMLIDGDRERQVDAYACWNVICRQLGWGGMKSIRFSVERNGRAYQFRGHGLGHGVGLCQWVLWLGRRPDGLSAESWRSIIQARSWAGRVLKIDWKDRNLPAWSCVY